MNSWIRWRDDTAEPSWHWLAASLGMPALLATPQRPLGELALASSRLKDHRKLVGLLGEDRVRQDKDTRLQYAGNGTISRLRLRAGETSHIPDAVLFPRHENEVLTLLRICADADIAVAPFGGGSNVIPERGGHAAIAAINMSGLDNIVSVDGLSGLARVEAGITAAELARQLALRGLSFGSRSFGTVGGAIAQGLNADMFQMVRVATPRGLLASDVPQLMRGSRGALGIVTGATLRVCAAPARSHHLRSLFPDFASGLVALRAMQRCGLAHVTAHLSDADETRLRQWLDNRIARPSLWQRLDGMYRQFRHLDDKAAVLSLTFNGEDAEIEHARRQFAGLARKLGALVRDALPPHDISLNSMLLDRGAAADHMDASASWASLPHLYKAVRGALDRAMRAQAPRPGAHGLVLCGVANARHDGADLRFTFVYPRILKGDVAQALAIRRAGAEAIGAVPRGELDVELMRSIKQLLDPGGILNPEIP
jgi:alkyldihydroxyacetonephosphate synthase